MTSSDALPQDQSQLTESNLTTGERIARLESDVAALRSQLTALERAALRLDGLLKPANSLPVGLVLCAVFALAIGFFFEGETEWYYLYYFVPIGLPFVGFVFDRVWAYTRLPALPLLPVMLDAAVVVLALVRAAFFVPLISGHALFLTFALLTVRSNWVRIPAALVLVEVILLKIFQWNNDPTLYSGLLVGLAAAGVWQWLRRARFSAFRG